MSISPQDTDPPALGVMYQPLNRDAEMGPYGWNYLFQSIARTPIEFGVVQWVQYGADSFSQPTPWLATALSTWQRHMPLWLGLHTEHDYFTKMAEGKAAQQEFFTTYLRKVNGTAARWQGWIQQHQAQFLGWYIPLELSDAYFATADERRQLHDFLRELKQRLGRSPLAISVFMSAELPASEFDAWLQQIQDLGYQVWLQDGAGTQALTATQREAYFAHLNCDVGLINEAFIQTSQQPFRARPATPAELAKAQARQPDCHPRILFSLRYLPEAAGVLYLSDLITHPPGKD
ncbi:DUF4434 domain-containing protein [Pseudidiomarina sp. 1APP75-27a]|uniref:DUF4434 domain-containing protein n=1 Tax=Pseudidiomarina terrestris TaxID=2820060 RepID=UPI002B05468B|nr:DUF4434 domain-containing protein [Pseudidiomarina sp. 1APP75-27a]MEA3588551.1 DUF4434 domain-containing protein [Pseudidiomarina sp. 1APP75-27a]